MLRAFLIGARLAVTCWPLVLTLWFVSALAASGFGWASGYWLAQALDGSIATRTLLKDLDPNIFVDLYYHHFASFRMLLLIAVFLVPAYALLWCWLHAVVIVTVRSAGDLDVTKAFRQGWDFAARMLQLLLIALTALSVFSAIVFAAARAARYLTVASPLPFLHDGIIAAAVTAWILGFILLTAVHDHARIRACAHGEGAVRAYSWAVGFVLHGGERAFLLAALLNLVGALLWLIYESVAWILPGAGGLGVAGGLLWGQMFLCARTGLRVWFFGAQNDLQSPA